MNFDEVNKFRKSREATAFTAGWLDAQRDGNGASDFHMNLLAWTSGSPGHVLGIVLNLIEQADDDGMGDAIGLGPVEWLVEKSPDDFLPTLREAVRQHSGFERFTRWSRENNARHRWAEIRP